MQTSIDTPTIHQFDLISEDFKASPASTYQEMHAAGPVVLSKLPLVGKTWMCTTYESCNALLRDHETFARDPTRAGKKFVAGFLAFMPRNVKTLSKNLMSVDGEEHRRLRSLVDQAFQRRTVEQMRPRLVEHADRFLEEMQTAADSNGKVDLIAHFARPFPLEVISELLGLPDDDRPNFSRLGNRLSKVRSLWTLLPAAFGLMGIRKFLKKQIAQCRDSPRPGLISAMIQSNVDGDRFTDDEILAMSFLLLLAGHETTVHLIATTIATLLDHESQKERLVSDWSLARSAVEESLRFISPIQISKPRMVACDTEFFGQYLKRGEYIIAMLGAANHDPDHFSDPETFDITRDPNPHLSFGSGIHTCLGLKLARAETEIALQQLFTRYPNLSLKGPHKWTRRLGMRTFDSLEVNLEK